MTHQPAQPGVEEMNSAIALFMGAEFKPDWANEVYPVPRPNFRFPDGEAPTEHSTYNWSPGALEYHKRWDWLMPVGKKIFEYMQVDIKKRPPHTLSDGDWLESAIGISIRDYDLAGAHRKIYEFILWHNSQKQQP